MPAYARMQTDSPEIIADVSTYGRTVCVFSFGLFFESIWTNILQARGNMKLPMIAQIVGAVINIALAPLLICIADKCRILAETAQNGLTGSYACATPEVFMIEDKAARPWRLRSLFFYFV